MVTVLLICWIFTRKNHLGFGPCFFFDVIDHFCKRDRPVSSVLWKSIGHIATRKSSRFNSPNPLSHRLFSGFLLGLSIIWPLVLLTTRRPALQCSFPRCVYEGSCDLQFSATNSPASSYKRFSFFWQLYEFGHRSTKLIFLLLSLNNDFYWM